VTTLGPFGGEPTNGNGTLAWRDGQRGGVLPETEPEIEPEAVLQVELEAMGTSCRLTLRGDLCDTSLSALEVQVDQLGCLPCERVIVDLRQLTRLDPVGAKVILGLYHYVVGRGGEMRVTEANGAVTATLQAAGGDIIPGARTPR
jgi:anti-anti-sigma factor